MWHRRRKGDATQDRGTSDPVATAIWQEGHLLGEASAAPIIKAPRAGELDVASDAA